MSAADAGEGSTGHQSRGRFIDGATFGAFLQNHREGRNLSLHDIACETKIAARHLAALEQGDIHSWPAGVYRRAWVRAYATAIGLDPDATGSEFADVFDDKPAQLEPDPCVESRSLQTLVSVRPRAAAYVGLGLCAAFAAFAWAARPSDAAGGIAPVRLEQVSTGGHHDTAAAPIPTSGPASPRDPANIETRRAIATPMPPASVPANEPATPMEVSMQIISEPAGARVTVNGIGWGQTPVTVRHLTPGEKRVRISKDGHISAERRLYVTPETPTQAVEVKLAPDPEA